MGLVENPFTCKQALASDLSKVCLGGKVEAKGGGLQVEGDHVTNVKRWLSGLGL